jgi:hypothetical protein
MEITRNVILDLLPLYLANEVSADTHTLIENYLKTDSELAKVAKQLSAMEKPGNVPVPITQDDNLKAYRRARRVIILSVLGLAAAISFAFIIITLIVYFVP